MSTTLRSMYIVYNQAAFKLSLAQFQARSNCCDLSAAHAFYVSQVLAGQSEQQGLSPAQTVFLKWSGLICAV